LQRHWAFRNHDDKGIPKQLVLYLLNAFLSLNINGVGMHFLVNELHVPYLLAQIMVNLGLGGINYIVYKSIIFRNEQDDETNCKQEQTDSI
jgi:putative flippase GtrA